MQGWRWDVFCRVIDNFGDVGVSWRLAAALGARGQTVRLWLDETSALSWMAPQGAPGVQVILWTDPAPDLPPADGVVEAFGCDPPPAFVARMAAMQSPPVWINLEYLSAEAYVERCHGLRSPQLSGPGAGLLKWFFYPGFTPATGGLLRGDAAPDPTAARAWLARRFGPSQPGERSVLLFGYSNPALPSLLQALAPQPTRLLLPPGPMQAQLAALALPPGQRATALPHLPQPDFDRLLAATDLNLVRGEDSFTQAQLQGDGPALWQIYPQHDGAHAAKLAAFLDLQLAGCEPGLATAVRQAQRVINGLAPGPLVLPDLPAWRAAHAAWQARLRAQDDLLTQLLRFVQARRA